MSEPKGLVGLVGTGSVAGGVVDGVDVTARALLRAPQWMPVGQAAMSHSWPCEPASQFGVGPGCWSWPAGDCRQWASLAWSGATDITVGAPATARAATSRAHRPIDRHDMTLTYQAESRPR